MPPEPTLSQNPLSIMMSRMSKFAMPSSTPLYHDAIKTVASSDDDSPPARSPNLPPMNSVPGKKKKYKPKLLGNTVRVIFMEASSNEDGEREKP